MNNDLKTYLENIKKPWGILFYRMIFEQLPQLRNARILDFGSGFGITANHLAKQNEVIAIEPNCDMVEMRICEHEYTQIVGDIEHLKQQPDQSFDLIVCHNVLEYVTGREEIFKEFCRILKPNGMISLVKHNHVGRIMQKVVFENNIDEALSLLDGGAINVMNFGAVHYYNPEDVMTWIGDQDIHIQKVLGLRTFWALQQNNDLKNAPSWQDKMFEIELKVCDCEEFVNISFFNHILLKKYNN